MNIDQIVKVDIALNTAGISKLGFNTIMVCGPHAKTLERVLAISDPDELLDLGFESTDPIYVAVNTAFSQTPAPSEVKVGRWQCDSIKVGLIDEDTVQQGVEYSVDINYYDAQKNVKTITGSYEAVAEDTASNVLTQISTALGTADTEKLFSCSVSGSEVLIKASNSQTTFTVTPNERMKVTLVEQADDIDVAKNMQLISDADDDWYGVVCTDRSDDTVLAMAAWAEGQTKLYGVSLSGDTIKNAESKEDIARYEAEGRKPHYRFKLEDGVIEWNDMVRGKTRYNAANLADPVIIREDGSYLYHLPSVIDDFDFGITHIIRGEDHVTNTAAQIQMFEAIGGRVPQLSFRLLPGGQNRRARQHHGNPESRRAAAGHARRALRRNRLPDRLHLR